MAHSLHSPHLITVGHFVRKEAVYGGLTEDLGAQKRLEEDLDEVFNVINVLHFVADFPTFRRAVWKYPASETLDRVRFLQYFFSKSHLDEVAVQADAQLLLEASFAQLDATLQHLMSTCGVSNDEAKRLIIADPAIVQSDEERQRLKKNLVLIGEMFPKADCTSADAIRVLKRAPSRNEERRVFMEARGAKTAQLHFFSRGDATFCRQIECPLEDFLAFQQRSHDKDANVGRL